MLTALFGIDDARTRRSSADGVAPKPMSGEVPARQGIRPSRANGHAAEGAAQVMIPRQQVPQPMRQAQHPLTDWHIGQDVIDQMRSPLRHAPPTTARAEPAALAREGDQSIEPARGAPKASEAAGQAAAPQEVAKLLLDKAREAFAVTQRRGLGTERLEMVSDDPVQDGGRGIARSVRGRWLRHASPSGARHATAWNRESGLNVSYASARSLRVTTAVAPSSDRSERRRR
jgi:hypothetical protein